MKKIIFAVLIALIFSVNVHSEDTNKELIRFHVIANSNEAYDQELKLRVRDEILKELTPKLELSEDVFESEKILKENLEIIKDISEKKIREEGYNYDIKVEFNKSSYFPVKNYGNITLPAGKYKSLKVKIGEAKGENWFCVMFPPLCIVKGESAEFSDAEKIKNILSENNERKAEIRFKFLEIFKRT